MGHWRATALGLLMQQWEACKSHQDSLLQRPSLLVPGDWRDRLTSFGNSEEKYCQISLIRVLQDLKITQNLDENFIQQKFLWFAWNFNFYFDKKHSKKLSIFEPILFNKIVLPKTTQLIGAWRFERRQKQEKVLYYYSQNVMWVM